MEDRISGFRMMRAAGSQGGAGTGTKCGRWNPTTEQVKVLTELFRSGLRTPSTDQIQKISNQLSFYGKIESKNVFYWFQNHKARERQKRRKVSMDENDFAAAAISRRDDKLITSPKRFVEVNGNNTNTTVGEAHERVLETLQLFPLNSVEEPPSTTEQEKVARLHRDDQCREIINGTFCFGIGPQTTHEYPPLDLRLSFV